MGHPTARAKSNRRRKHAQRDSNETPDNIVKTAHGSVARRARAAPSGHKAGYYAERGKTWLANIQTVESGTATIDNPAYPALQQHMHAGNTGRGSPERFEIPLLFRRVPDANNDRN